MKKIFILITILFVSGTIFAQQSNYQQLAQEVTRNLTRNEQEYNRLLALLNETQNNSRFAHYQRRIDGVQRQIENQEKIVEENINRPAVQFHINNSIDELRRLNNRLKTLETEFRNWLNSL